jgi:hypothetical protein
MYSSKVHFSEKRAQNTGLTINAHFRHYPVVGALENSKKDQDNEKTAGLDYFL